MAKLILNLVEGGSISLESKEGFIELTHTGKDKKEKTVGLLRRGDFLYLRSFIESDLATGSMQIADSGEVIVKAARAAAREVKKIMDSDEDQEEKPPPPPEED